MSLVGSWRSAAGETNKDDNSPPLHTHTHTLQTPLLCLYVHCFASVFFSLSTSHTFWFYFFHQLLVSTCYHGCEVVYLHAFLIKAFSSFILIYGLDSSLYKALYSFESIPFPVSVWACRSYPSCHCQWYLTKNKAGLLYLYILKQNLFPVVSKRFLLLLKRSSFNRIEKKGKEYKE